jgi:hypothetical protein
VVKCTDELLKKYHTVYFHDGADLLHHHHARLSFVCTYCHQSELVKTYPTREYKSRVLRYKSVQRTIDEINHQTRRFPFLTNVGFSDDDFFRAPSGRDPRVRAGVLEAGGQAVRRHGDRLLHQPRRSCSSCSMPA